MQSSDKNAIDRATTGASSSPSSPPSSSTSSSSSVTPASTFFAPPSAPVGGPFPNTYATPSGLPHSGPVQAGRSALSSASSSSSSNGEGALLDPSASPAFAHPSTDGSQGHSPAGIWHHPSQTFLSYQPVRPIDAAQQYSAFPVRPQGALTSSSSGSNVGALLRRFSAQNANLLRAQLHQPAFNSNVVRRPNDSFIVGEPGAVFTGDPTRLYHAPGNPSSGQSTSIAGSASPHHFAPSTPTGDLTHGHPSVSSPHPTFDPSSRALNTVFEEPPSPFDMNRSNSSHSLQRGASATSSSGYTCPNCGKTFARDDLLRRHLAREARAAAQPSLDRQKSCFECARSKARCDLEVPACGRCRARGKTCTYGARSGNPNVRKNSGRSSAAPDMAVGAQPGGGGGGGGGGWGMADSIGGAGVLGSETSHHWHPHNLPMAGNTPHGAGMYAFPRNSGAGAEGYESDDSHTWSDSYGHPAFQHRGDRTLSTSSGTTSESFDYHSDAPVQHSSPQQHNLDPSAFPQQGTSYGHMHHQNPVIRTTSIDTSVQRPRIDDDEATPVNRTSAMGPPLVTPTRAKDVHAGTFWPSEGSLKPALVSSSSRPQVPRLLTGARMPRPPEAGHASARPLFSAQLDLSGWLEEPVIPSPLYRMGPSLSALGAAGQSFILPTPTATMLGPGASQLLANLHANDTIMQQGESDPNQQGHDRQSGRADSGGASQHAQVAARNWWAAGPQERSAIDAQEVAQACAGHFTLYPALMVLPDPTSPVPPLFHRPWLAFIRLDTPPALAHVRVALAAYHVRLPASESMIWDMIRMQAKMIVASYDVLAQASDVEVFSSTASLWFLVILLLMSTDPTSGQGVDENLTDSCLVGLSHLARLLLQRVQAREQQMQVQGSDNNNSPTFLDWGFVETMRRTLFACYTLFVLQRFRPTSAELQSRLAGAELVLDIKLPATASEFEAGDELEWRAAQHVKITDEHENTFGGALTLRELLQARSNAQQEEQERRAQSVQKAAPSPPSSSPPPSRPTQNEAQEKKDSSPNEANESSDPVDEDGHSAYSPVTEARRKQMLTYFDRHDDFTNVCLTVSFALDARI